MTGKAGAALPRIALIGYGAIADDVVRCLEVRGEISSLAGILVRPQQLPRLRPKASGRFPLVEELAALLDLEPAIVIEAAGHEAVARLGAAVLARRIDLLIASVGALADRKLAQALVAAAPTGTELWIAAGAVAGIDGLLAARTAGLSSVTYTSLKAPEAWNGTPAQEVLAGESAQTGRVIFFRGSAREAAAKFPQNANVAATIALASLGLDRTRVLLGSDPHVSGPLGIIEAEGEFGRFNFEILALASPTNPKTSALTGHSLVAAVRDGMCLRTLDLLRDP